MLSLAVLCHTIDLQVEHTALLLLSRVTWQSVIAASAVEKSCFLIFAILSQMQLIVQPYFAHTN